MGKGPQLPYNTDISEDPAPVPAYETLENLNAIITDGSIHFIAQEGGNTSAVTYQEVDGAPVEAKSPLGYSVDSITVLILNVSMIIGTGIFSTRKPCPQYLLRRSQPFRLFSIC